IRRKYMRIPYVCSEKGVKGTILGYYSGAGKRESSEDRLGLTAWRIESGKVSEMSVEEEGIHKVFEGL
ncbi:hypothetical protein A2U01_0006245, partial [Trifolium medium]|nr:hypothetical protein [Trifolium medium]